MKQGEVIHCLTTIAVAMSTSMQQSTSNARNSPSAHVSPFNVQQRGMSSVDIEVPM